MAASSPSNNSSASQNATGVWNRLKPEEFQQLQEYTKYAKTSRLTDVLQQFRDGVYPQYNPEKPMDYEGFKLFMSAYLGDDVSEDLCQHLFWAFHKQVAVNSPSLSQTIIDSVAATVVSNSQQDVHKFDQRRPFKVANEHPPAHPRSSSQRKKMSSEQVNLLNVNPHANTVPMVSIREIACYLSMLEGGKVEDKLEFVFRVYDSDGNEYLDSQELECITQQMMSVAQYLGWDVTELKPILQDMLVELDDDADGQISLDEWIKGGLTTIPLRVLLGLETQIRDDGQHQWRQKYFSRPAYCNMCHNVLNGFGRKQGLQCLFCKYTVHERCVQRAPASCINTYVKQSRRSGKMSMDHHWTEGNCPGKCFKCGKNVKSNNCLTGLRCAWCQVTVHNKCATHVVPECNLGEHRDHILPPVSISPAGLDRKKENSTPEAHRKRANSYVNFEGMPMQISPLRGTHPLAVFINPKSGGRQGARLLHKFQYLLNPRQVFNLGEGGPGPGLKFFQGVSDFRVLCCGGDGTAGWVLATIDKLQIKKPPPVAILPLGTGNDLARCLKWGGGYEGGSISKVLSLVQKSSVVSLDRWSVSFKRTNSEDIGDPPPLDIINNYFSIGVDASVALKFHLQREKNPEKFNSRLKNKLRYFECGTSETISATCKNLHEDIEIVCDGTPLELPQLEGIAVINIPSVYGGANLWGETDKKKVRKSRARASGRSNDLEWAVQDIGDGQLEVVGLKNSLDVGQIIAGVRAHGLRLAQCSSITIRSRKLFPMQIDGEPWMQPSAEIVITHHNQVPMLQGPPPVKNSFFFRRRPVRDAELESEM
ncbi:hypothetical protein ABFA07_015603 [Porites harrisoni]